LTRDAVNGYQTGDVSGEHTGVADEAVATITDESRCLAGAVFHGVEDRPLPWRDSGDFHDVAALHPADVHVVSKIECAGLSRRNMLQLQARLTKNQHLR